MVDDQQATPGDEPPARCEPTPGSAAAGSRTSTAGVARRPTIADVAREAGVSSSLVSLVLQRPEKVSERRKQAVHEAMARLGYRPNAAARSLAQARTGTIGIIVSDLHNPFYTDIIDGIEEVELAAGYRALIANGNRDERRELDAANGFVELRVEGLVLITPRLTNDEIAELAEQIPTVIVGRPGTPPRGCSRVHTDDAAGMEVAVAHLHGLGHTRIAHVSAGDGPGARARERGYRTAMARRGLTAEIRVAREVPNEEGGRAGTMRLFREGPPPTAVIASNDYAAVGVLDALGDLGLSCPEEVSVVGYDNSTLAQTRQILLTSVNQPRREMGNHAATMLAQHMADGRSRSLALAPDLVVRITTAQRREPGAGDAVPDWERPTHA